MEEDWKEVPGFENFYLVSKSGKVFSIRSNKVLSPGDNGRGYLFVNLTINGKVNRFYIHRLVALAFVENNQFKDQVNHKDCNKRNNNYTNLEWVSADENLQHAVSNNRMYTSEYQKSQIRKANSGTKSHLSKLKDTDIPEIRRLKSTGLINAKIAKIFSVNRETIGYILRGKTWKHI